MLARPTALNRMSFYRQDKIRDKPSAVSQRQSLAWVQTSNRDLHAQQLRVPYKAPKIAIERWHENVYDITALGLQTNKQILPHIFRCTLPKGKVPAIAKLLRGQHATIDSLAQETRLYQRIQGAGIGPRFLGHVAQDGRIIGLLLEHVDGRDARIEDLKACEKIVKRFHALGLVHRDMQGSNFVVVNTSSGLLQCVLIDFETACESGDGKLVQRDLSMLRMSLE